MTAHKIRMPIPSSRELRVVVPADFGDGDVEVIVMPVKPITTARGLTVDELIAARLRRPPHVPTVSLEDMEAAIARGATS